jgi:hypothetical protein
MSLFKPIPLGGLLIFLGKVLTLFGLVLPLSFSIVVGLLIAQHLA